MNLRMIRWFLIPFTGYKFIRRFIGGRWEYWSVDGALGMSRQWFPVTEPSVAYRQPSENCILLLHAEVHIPGEFG